MLLRCHIVVASISKSSYLLSFSKILSNTLVSIGIEIWMRKQVLSLWIFTTMSSLFTWIALSVWISKSHKMVVFLFSMTFGGLCSHQFLSYLANNFCTDLIYHADLDILWVLVWDSQAQGGQWSQFVTCSAFWVSTIF